MSDLKTCFRRVDYQLSDLLAHIDNGFIGLADIQRPFVWSDTKVRDLFDSMFRGFPVGCLVFWEHPEAKAGNDLRKIGIGPKPQPISAQLIVDGQQRLTALYAIFRGKPVLDEEYKERRIEIAFCPRSGKFEVADAANRKDPEFIPDISEVLSFGRSVLGWGKDFLKTLESKKPLKDEEEEQISRNLERLCGLQQYPFNAVEIASSVMEEQAAELFVRINSAGMHLQQADFILTLLSVFWEEGRRELVSFSRNSHIPSKAGAPSSFNQLIKPGPDQMLRVGVALSFYRGRLRSVYQILRGKDLNTEEFSVERRDLQFAKLKEAQNKVLNLTNWQEFLGYLVGAGFRSGDLISSETAVLYSYAFYLIGKIQCGVSHDVLRKLIGRWFLSTTLSGRYTSSPETRMEEDLNRLKELPKMADSFVALLDQIINDTLTNDFWKITLPNDLDSSSARSPQLFAYISAQILLRAPVLFSNKMVSDALDPTVNPPKKPIDRHHLFPRSWLESQGITDLKVINQTANFALLEWRDDVEISDTPPREYVPKMRARFSPEEWGRMCELHALPDGWETMAYGQFLASRRVLMSQIIRRGFEVLK